jgi:hypothetical protein
VGTPNAPAPRQSRPVAGSAPEEAATPLLERSRAKPEERTNYGACCTQEALRINDVEAMVDAEAVRAKLRAINIDAFCCAAARPPQATAPRSAAKNPA